MVWLAAYVVTMSVLLGMLFLNAFRRGIPEKCFTCSNYEVCLRDGNCEKHGLEPPSLMYQLDPSSSPQEASVPYCDEGYTQSK